MSSDGRWGGALVLLLGFACGFTCAYGCGDGEREDARRFLSAYAGLNHRDGAARRERSVSELERLPVHAESVVKARDACVAAHRGLLSAERAQESAAAALDGALAAKPAAAALDQAAVADVQARITKAEAALALARDRFSACESAAQSLALRFGPR